MFAPAARTVYVPIFESDSFRRDLGEELTEAVVKCIQRRTTLQLAPSLEADLLLAGRITHETKRVLVENRNDEPRDVNAEFRVRLNLIDRTGQVIRGPINVPVAPLLLDIGQDSHFVPEAGQSYATARQQALRRLAEEIVDQLEMPW